MVTGDNILTAVSVSRNCGLLQDGDKLIRVVASQDGDNHVIKYHVIAEDGTPLEESKDRKINIDNSYHFALDGFTFDIIAKHYKEELLPYIARRGTVFARMRPDMKQELVETLQDLGYFVGMCGDGANDCGALKAAHSGISLSESEASVASPFTSKTPDISCVPQLIREGRAALVTSFGIFKYMAAYSITQFVSVMILYEIFSNLSDTQFLYIDLFVITTLAAFFGLNRAYEGRLASSPPENSLISPLPLFSLICQLAIVTAFQVLALRFTQMQSWFVEFNDEEACFNGTIAEDNFNSSGLLDLEKCTADESPVACYENYAIFSVSQFQYIILAISFAKGAPYRTHLFYNIPLLADIVVLTSFSLYLTISPHVVFISGFITGFELFHPPEEFMNFRLELIGLAAANLVASVFCELVVADILVKKIIKKKNQFYDRLEKELKNKPDWPPLSDSSATSAPPTFVAEISNRNHVIITEKGISDPSDAFDNLFSTPPSASHKSAAVLLNPPPYSPRKEPNGVLVNLKPTEGVDSNSSTPYKKPESSTTSTPGLTETDSSVSISKFASCNSILEENGEGNQDLNQESCLVSSPNKFR